jgi:protein phosphatase
MRHLPLHLPGAAGRGPFDVIGDVHGCFDELVRLLARLGYRVAGTEVEPPPGRRLCFVGDLVDRGPQVAAVLRLVMSSVEAGTALCVYGNHEYQLLKRLRDPDAEVAWGLAETLAQLAVEPRAFTDRTRDFAAALPTQLILDDGGLVVVHAGLPEHLHGAVSDIARRFALYGPIAGEYGDDGEPVHREWAREYQGRARVVYGHTPIRAPAWVGRTICIDTGCVYGGALTALRYPELELVSEPAQRVHYRGD